MTSRTAVLAAAAVLGTCLLTVPPAAAEAPPARSVDPACPAEEVGPSRYADVPDESTFSREITCVSGHGIAQGYEAFRYAPEAPVSRRQMVRFLHRFAQGIPLPDGSYHGQPTFPDLAGEPAEVRAAVASLTGLGVVRGVSEDRFDPDGLVTRAQMASFLQRLQQSVEVNVVRTFDPEAFPFFEDAFDDDEGSIHEDAINGLAANGLVQGVEPGVYAPGRPVSRGQMAAYLARHLSYLIAEQDAIGSAYDEPVRARGEAHLDETPENRYPHGFLLVPDDGTEPFVVRFDDNDAFVLGDAPQRTFDELQQALSYDVHDVVDLVYRRWALQQSEVHLVLDRVTAPWAALASPAGDAVDLLLPWTAGLEVTRERGGSGADGACRTADDAPLQPDGEVGLPPDSSGTFRDHGLARTDCYRYTFTTVSPWTPEEGRASTLSNVVQPGDPDRTGPTLVDLVREDDDTSLRLVFSEPVVATSLSGVFAQCIGGGAYQNPSDGFAQSGDDVIATFGSSLEPCGHVWVPEATVRDLAGNLSQEQEQQID